MWPLPRIQNKLITLCFEQNALNVGLIQPSTKSSAAHLVDFLHIPSTEYQIHNGIIRNAPALAQTVTEFVHKHRLKYPFAAATLCSRAVQESFVSLSTATPKQTDFGISIAHHHVWQSNYLYPQENGLHLFYLTNILPAKLYHTQLFGIMCNLNMLRVTTSYQSWLDAYQLFRGAAYRASALAADMEHCALDIPNFFTPDRINRMLTLPNTLTSDVTTHRNTLLSMLGLWHTERDVYE